MTHEGILKELYEVCVFLQDKEAEIEAKYGEEPSFDSPDDRRLYDVLMEACHDKAISLISAFDIASGYKKAISVMKAVNGERYHVGDGLKKARETGQLAFED